MSTAAEWASASWDRLLGDRSAQVHRFLVWAARTEQPRQHGVRLADRDDLTALRSVISLFPEPWWGICVYSCVDRAEGTRMLARFIPEPLPRELADRRVPPGSAWPRGMIGSHRSQAGFSGASICLLSMCDRQETLQEALTGDMEFDRTVQHIRRLKAPQIGRTTAYDLVLRAGQLLHDPPVEPASAHLLGSTGPARGFEAIWGFDPAADRRQAERAEAILRLWTLYWHDVADRARVPWPGTPFSAGDFESALCIYQDHRLCHRFGTP